MNIAHTTLPEYFSGMLNGSTWVNQINAILAFASIPQDIKKVNIQNSFTPTIGTLYLVAAGSISPYTPGTVVIWFDPTKPPQGFNPSSGTVLGEWTKNIAGNNWINDIILDMRNGSTFLSDQSVPTTITIPNLLEGKMTIINAGTGLITVFPGSGRTGKGKVTSSTPLGIGTYTCYQNSTITVI